MNRDERELRLRLATDLEFYAEKCLKIRSTEAKIVPFVFNRAQRRFLEAVNRQRERTGMVRFIIPKARQLGFSTVIGAMGYHQTTHHRAFRAFILTHKDDATRQLFEMVRRFHDNVPPQVKPEVRTSNINEIIFGKLDSSYGVGTAKGKDIGRGQTINFLHWSECSFCDNAANHATDLFQAVHDVPGTSIFMESTGNGVGDFFHSQTMAALEGKSKFEVFFAPWYWKEDNIIPDVPRDFTAPDWLKEWQRAFELTSEQIYWAYCKNREAAVAEGKDPGDLHWRFQQEHPTQLEDVFQAKVTDALIQVRDVQRAMSRTDINLETEAYAPTVLGLDAGGGGDDCSWLIDRKGRCAGFQVNERLYTSDDVEIADWAAHWLDKLKAVLLCIDITGGYGKGVYSILRSRGYGPRIVGVGFAERARDPQKYPNRRTEIWDGGREWIEAKEGCAIIDDPILLQHLTCVSRRRRGDQQIALNTKDDIRKKFGFSPDGGDALNLTFAEPVATVHKRATRGAGGVTVRGAPDPLDDAYL